MQNVARTMRTKRSPECYRLLVLYYDPAGGQDRYHDTYHDLFNFTRRVTSVGGFLTTK
jgi:hypothetical protein